MEIKKKCLAKAAIEGDVDIIAHGCNCFNRQKSGIARTMVSKFGTDSFPMEQELEGYYGKLGNIDHVIFKRQGPVYERLFGRRILNAGDPNEFVVINAYTQYKYGTDVTHIDYTALEMCLKKINHSYPGKRVGLPWIGCGLAGGDKEIVKDIIERSLKDCKVIIFEL